jgi:hypothetical protein
MLSVTKSLSFCNAQQESTEQVDYIPVHRIMRS